MDRYKKSGVLLVNLGTPDSPSRSDVYKYLKQFLLDPRVIDVPWLQRNLLVRGIIAPFRSKPSSDAYKKLWTGEGSPLKVYGYRLLDGVRERLGESFAVELAMRYQNPSISDALDKLFAQKISQLIVFPLFPQYASASTGSVHEEVMRLLSARHEIPKTVFVNSYCENPGYIQSFLKRAEAYDLKSYDHILFSYHGLPERQLLKADTDSHCLQSADCCQNLGPKNQFCYSAQCNATTRELVKKLGIPTGTFTICFQSRLGKTPWLRPFTIDVIKDLAEKGAKRVLVFCPAFIADCLETTIEISEEYQEEFIESGGDKLDLVEGLNDLPEWMDAVADMILENLN